MVCAYCDSVIVRVPDNRICPHCGAALPKEDPSAVSQTWDEAPPVPGVDCCIRCNSRAVTVQPRGFSVGLAILGFCLLSVFGIPFGFIGAKTSVYHCQCCGKKWKC